MSAQPIGPDRDRSRIEDELRASAAVGLEELLGRALVIYGDRLRIAASFGVEDMVVLDAACVAGDRVGVSPRVFFLDTGRIHQETYDLVDRVRDRYRIGVEIYAPAHDEVEALVRAQGPNGFYRSIEERKACCAVRKLGPLSRALEGAGAWVTGLRRAQSPTRSRVAVVEGDSERPGVLKLNPLFDWDEARVWERVRARGIPTNALHAQGYPSIGCVPCTRAVAPGEDPRAGRWWWESAEHKECGLHRRGR